MTKNSYRSCGPVCINVFCFNSSTLKSIRLFLCHLRNLTFRNDFKFAGIFHKDDQPVSLFKIKKHEENRRGAILLVTIDRFFYSKIPVPESLF